MANKIKLQYNDIYNETSVLKSFVADDIQKENMESYGNMMDIVDEMDGKTNFELYQTLLLHQSQLHEITSTLQNILTFIERSTKEMEKKDREIAIKVKAKENSDVKIK